MIIFADFNNFDQDGFIRLNTIGTIRDLADAGIVLHEGLRLTVSDNDLKAEIQVMPPANEGVWRGKVVSVIEEFDHSSKSWSPL
ncbi:MAG: hypothetical protein IPO95_07445 [Rhodanobacteraceae bacterium]|nr:hypothetical protein [Rhodanobacteraceae bacterium]